MNMKTKLIPGDKLIWDYGGYYDIVLFVGKTAGDYKIALTNINWKLQIVVNQLLVDKKQIMRYNKKNLLKMLDKHHRS